ncbi:hypothetical protein GS682_04815 [Nostoc sp. B(2019)]|nr:hypothetical protein [Nostoc sp. B(2019)]
MINLQERSAILTVSVGEQLRSILNRSKVAAVISWADEAIAEALELNEYPVNSKMSEIEACACSPTYWVGVLEYKQLAAVLTEDELDLVVEHRCS